MKNWTNAEKLKYIHESHAMFIVGMILQDDGWIYNEIIGNKVEALLNDEDYEAAASILVANGWKAEVVY